MQDKLEFSKRLAARGLPAPPTLAALPQGEVISLGDLPWPTSGGLFIKPRHGSCAVGAFSLTRVAIDQYLINGNSLAKEQTLLSKLNQLLEKDSLLVQTFFQPVKELADLSSQSPLELRITTSRQRDGESQICACFMKVQPPGKHAATAATGALVIPIEPASGLMEPGLLLSDHGQRHALVPWNGARVTGRTIPDYDQIKSLILAASRELPSLPFIGWDVLLTTTGPIILEANCGLSWRLIHLRHALQGIPTHLPDLVREWISQEPTQIRC